MAIYGVVLDQQTGSVNATRDSALTDVPKVFQEYVEEYLVVTDHTDTPADIYEAAVAGYTDTNTNATLPNYDSVCGNTDIKVSHISIERWDTANMKAVPTFGLSPKEAGSYASWKYSVTYTETENSGGVDTETAPWNTKYAQNCTLTPKEYTENTARAYASPTNKKRVRVLNAAGDPVYRNAKVRNYILSFDYAAKDFKAEWVIQANSTCNKEDITVAGIDIPAGCGLISTMNISVQKWKQQTYYQVHVEIELAVEKPVVYTKLLGAGYCAYLPKVSTTVSYPIHKFTGPPSSMEQVDEKWWFDKSRGYGCFSSVSAVKGLYENVSDKMVLNQDGTLFTGFEKGKDIDLEKYKDTLNMISVAEHLVKDWSGLGFPKKGLLWDTASSNAYDDSLKEFLYGGLASRLS